MSVHCEAIMHCFGLRKQLDKIREKIKKLQEHTKKLERWLQKRKQISLRKYLNYKVLNTA